MWQSDRLLGAAAACVVLAWPAAAIFKEEAGVIDWRNQYVGGAASISFANSGKVAVVSTRGNVLAGINARNGDLGWRHVLSDADTIDMTLDGDEDIYTVSHSGATVRKWSAREGFLIWEGNVYPRPIIPPSSTQLPLRLAQEVDHWQDGVDAHLIPGGEDPSLLVLAANTLKLFDSRSGDEIWAVALQSLIPDAAAEVTFLAAGVTDKSILVVGVSVSHGKAEYHVQTRSLQTGQGSKEAPFQFPFSYNTSTSCRVVGTSLVCVHGKQLHLLPLQRGSEASVIELDEEAMSLENQPASKLSVVVQYSRTRKQAFRLSDGVLKPIKALTLASAIGVMNFEGKEILVGAMHPNAQFVFVEAATGDSVSIAEPTEVTATLSTIQAPTICGGYLFRRTSDNAIGFALILGSEDLSLLGVRKGEITWAREESLAHVSSVVFVDLPPVTTDLDSNIRKIVESDGALSRDYFNKKKMLVLATLSGKVHGMLSEKGEKRWTFFPDDLTSDVITAKIYSIRPATLAHAMVLAVVQTETGWHMYELNPLTGHLYQSIKLPYDVQLITETPVQDNTGATILTILDSNELLHVYPETAYEELKLYNRPIYMYTINEISGRLRGFKASFNLSVPAAINMWTINFDPAVESIAAVATRHSQEKVNSVGETLGDRSVIYKYLNPNMLALATMTPYTRGSANMTVYILDTIKGSIVSKVYQTGVFGAVHLTQSSNWVVYHYRSRRSKRNEVGILELFTSSDDPPTSGFSSLDAAAPIVLRQAYIAPFAVSALTTTITDQGVTEPMLLAAMTSGSILGIQKRLVDSRRPTNDKAAKHAEGVPKYHPVVALPSTASLNHELMLSRVKAIYSSACGLESTTTVLATGLDLYLTQMEPSKKFDALSDDFPHTLLVASLVGLSSVVFYIRSRGTERKLRKLWK